MNVVAHQPLKKVSIDQSTLKNDPINVITHTLHNGLRVFMSVNKNEPRIYTHIAVRAGSKQDPCDTTGLAHYLEHMMFKGTHQIGSLDWEKEKALLVQIADLFEKHRFETDPSVRRQLYADIDRLSNEAAKYVATSEYDKLVSSLGAKATNAYTSNDQTVYVNDIPSNELEKWIKLESERFSMVVLRLFHTELETVYEEFNIGQDNDFRKMYYTMMSVLFPEHPYGTQPTIGLGEHLKNPSHYNILKYFENYYVANNMAISLSGDFEPLQAIQWIEQYFGDYKPRPVPAFNYAFSELLPQGTIKKEVLGQQAEYVQIAWRLSNFQQFESEMISFIGHALYNNQAGLIDLNLVQKQLVLEAYASGFAMADHSVFVMTGKPRVGQSLEQVEELLLEQLNRLKGGEFQEWLLEAVIKDYKYNQMKGFENNQNRVQAMTDAFVKNREWQDYIKKIDRLSRITKEELVAFANQHFNDNCVVLYKRAGIDPSVKKVEKPVITPVVLNRHDSSDYAKAFLETKSPRLQPVFVDYKKDIQTVSLNNGLVLNYIRNEINETFSLYYIFEMGKKANKYLPIALSYLPFLGTEQLTAAELQQELYRTGLSFDVYSNEDRSFIVLNGLQESFTEGVKLLDNILKNVQANKPALKNLVADLLRKRENEKKDKRVILRHALVSYAKYGKISPFTDILSQEELKNLDPQLLVNIIRNLASHEHQLFYYGSESLNSVKEIVAAYHRIPEKLVTVTTSDKYPELDTTGNTVLFVHYPMVQTEILMLSKGTPQYSPKEHIYATLFNNYFGVGLSSIIFQEIREARALAYSVNAHYSTPIKRDKAHYFQAYVGTQADKLKEAIHAIRHIIDNMPVSEVQIEHAKTAVLKTIESERITKTNIYWSYRDALERGMEHDFREDIYHTIQTLTAQDLKNFQEQYVKDRCFTYLVLGDKTKVDMDYLESLGQLQELTFEDIFGY